MKRYYYKNWLANILLAFTSCHTIAVAWVVLSKRDECHTNQVGRNHETIHALQWTEVTMVFSAFLFVLILVFNISIWWLCIAPLTYYAWYMIEWLCKLPFGNAYRSISFEQEAYVNDEDMNYVENRCLFTGWLKKVFTVVR